MIATPDKMETSPIMKSELSDEDQEVRARPLLIEQKDEPMLDGGSQDECLMAQSIRGKLTFENWLDLIPKSFNCDANVNIKELHSRLKDIIRYSRDYLQK